MNIGQAKKQIDNAVRAYLAKDERGCWRIPQRMQRPIIMFGPPGVGKTAIASQVADELGINFVSYSITHHTRQSALGLPYIATDEFDGREYRISDYTMSEIIAAVHRACKESGVSSGILFLDEVNCVSETLAPAMLQFLQFKTFGMHRLPEGWVIVCAGNPPEYNRSAREFDPAMLDRVKRIDVEPELSVWQDYAVRVGIHPAVTTFLDAKPTLFYRVHADVQAPRLVTARGWEDLARIVQAYELESLEVDADLVGQYLQDDQAAQEFFAYYQLFCKYRDDYQLPAILEGSFDDALVQRASQAPFDERVALVGMLLDAVLDRMHDQAAQKEALELARCDLQAIGDVAQDDFAQAVHGRITRVQESVSNLARQQGAPAQREMVDAEYLALLKMLSAAIHENDSEGLDAAAQVTDASAFQRAKAAFNSRVDTFEADTRTAMAALDNAFAFLDAAFGEESQEALIMVTKLSADPVLVQAVVEHGSQQYLKHNKALLLSERNTQLLQQVEELYDANHED